MLFKSKFLIFFILASACSPLMANDTDTTPKVKYTRLEALMNISNTLSRFTGNGTQQTVFEEPFLLGLKITNKAKTSGLRIGLNFSVKQVSEDLSGISKTTHFNSWAPLIGYEWRKYLGHHVEFYGGVDARYYNDINRTETRTFTSSGNDITIFNTTQTGWGFGPFCGIVYNLTPRISLLTEANLYLNYIRKLRNFSTDGTHYEVFEDQYTTNLSPTAPSSLFLVIRF